MGPRDRFYFVVDGLDEIPKEGPKVQDIVSLLPMGLPQFKFIFSGSTEKLLGLSRIKVLQKPVTLPGFSLDETIRFFSGVALSAEVIHEFQRACKGIPSNLAAVRRLLASGVPPESLVEQLPATLPNLFEMEWARVDESDDLQMHALALLCYDRRKHRVADVAVVLDSSPEKIKGVLSPLTCVKVSGETGEVDFVSESFRRFASERLHRFRGAIRSRLDRNLTR